MKKHVFTRRQFMRMTLGATAATGLGCWLSCARPGWQSLLSTDGDKAAVVWLEGQDCAGCTESVLACLSPDLRDVILDVVCIRYHETIMAGTGEVAHYALEEAIEHGGYVLVVEGSLPAADKDFLRVHGTPLEDTFVPAANQAAAILAIGACATFGGIPRAGVPDGQGVEYYLSKYSIDKPLINLPGCPVHPAWFFDTVLALIAGDVPSLDEHKRPLVHFGDTIHERCPRRRHYKNERFLLDWNDPRQRGLCLAKKGCKGPETHGDCPLLLWNEGANWCIGNNAPCAGCTEPMFYEGFSPLYKG